MKTAYEYIKEQFIGLTPSMAYSGQDFPTWQKAARQKLSQLVGLDQMHLANPDLQIEFEQEIENATEIRFTFQSEPGYRVPCHLLLPKGIKNPPVMICLQGHSKGMHISLGRSKYQGDEAMIQGGDRDFCVRAVQEGFAAIAVEQRNFGECGGTEKGHGCFEESLTTLLLGRTVVGERVWDIMRLIDLLKSNFAQRVNTENICCMGNSGGGTTTAYLAALEPRLTLAMPSCAVCTWEQSIAAVRHCMCNYVPQIARYFNMGDLVAMAYPTYYVQVNGAQDESFALQGAQSAHVQGKRAYADMGQAEDCALVIGPEGHRFYADLAWPIVHSYLKER